MELDLKNVDSTFFQKNCLYEGNIFYIGRHYFSLHFLTSQPKQYLGLNVRVGSQPNFHGTI